MKPIELNFESYGNAQGCPVIILHGFLASSRNWRTVAKNLAETHRVYVLDMRNHGASPHADAMNYPVMADDVLHFMDRMGLAQAHIVGHSMGGKIAMWLALHHPDRIQRLIIVDIAPVAYQHSFTPVIRALQQLPLHQLNNRKQAEQELAIAIPDLSFRQFLLQNLLLRDGAYYWRINLDIVQQTAHHIVDFPTPFFERFEFPALFIAGEYSNYVDTEAVMTRFPKAKLAIIPETGHWLYVEAPDVFCTLVVDWLAAN